MMKSLQITLLMALLLPVAANVAADPRPPNSSSYKSGFSSQKRLPTSTNRPRNPSFGAFGSKPAAPPAPVAAPAAPRQPGSALSKGLDQRNAEANALRTLDARRAAAQAAAAPSAVPAPGPVPPQYGPAPASVIVSQDNGVGKAMLGFLLGRATSGASGNNGYWGPGNNAGIPVGAGAPHESGFGTTVLRTFAWLLILGACGWLIYFGWKFLRRGKAPSSATYTFERN